MFNELPFPHITATDAKEQIKQLNDYLVYFKESLEFILMNISADNFSQELLDRLDALGVDIRTTNANKEEETQQITNRFITVDDVISSQKYQDDKEELETQIQELKTQIQELSDTYETDKIELDLQVQQLVSDVSDMEWKIQLLWEKVFPV